MNLNVRVNPGPQRDEVFITSDPKDPNYVNRTVYAKPGVFKEGELSAEDIDALEKKSAKAIEDELAATLAVEAKAREQAAKAPTKTKKEE